MSAAPVTPGQRWLLFGVLAGTFLLYVASFLGVVGANDGSHFATTQALATGGTFRIDDGFVFATSDVAAGAATHADGTSVLYSNKPPGTALLAVPFYWLGDGLHAFLKKFPPPDRREPNDQVRMRRFLYTAARDDFDYQGSVDEFVDAYTRDWPRQNAVNLLPALAGTACCGMLYLLARRLGAGFAPALVTMLLVGLGTLQWRYSTALFAHSFSALFLLVQLELLLSGRAWKSFAGALGFGLLVGYSGVLEYQALLTAPFVGVYWIGKASNALDRRRFASHLGTALLGTAIPLILLAGYQWKVFGSPWTLTATRSIHWQEAESVQRMLTAGSVRDGLHSMLLGNLRAEQAGIRGTGLLTTSPFLVLAVVGWFLCSKNDRFFAMLAGVCIVSHVTLMARVWTPMAGSTFDARYLLRIVPLTAVGFALFLERLSPMRHVLLRRVLYGALALLAVISIVNTIDTVGKFERHDIFLPSPASRVQLANLLRDCWRSVGDPSDFFVALVDLLKGIGYVTHACFSNRGNWPLFVVAVTMIGVLGLFFELRRRCDARRAARKQAIP